MKKLLIIYIVLIILTSISAFASDVTSANTKMLIMLLTGVKFYAIAFYFMDLKEAHVFWKTAIVVFFMIFSSVVLLM